MKRSWVSKLVMRSRPISVVSRANSFAITPRLWPSRLRTSGVRADFGKAR